MRVLFRTRDRPYRAALVRLCTRCLMACAKSDTRLAVTSRSCPFVHTGCSGVCKVGHADADSGDRTSACAHGTPARVQSRTRDRPCRAALVRLCTPSNAPCAQADTTTGEGPARLRAREGPTAGGHARQAETISSSKQGPPEQPLLRGAVPAGRSTDHWAACASLPGRTRAAPGEGALGVLRAGSALCPAKEHWPCFEAGTGRRRSGGRA